MLNFYLNLKHDPFLNLIKLLYCLNLTELRLKTGNKNSYNYNMSGNNKSRNRNQVHWLLWKDNCITRSVGFSDFDSKQVYILRISLLHQFWAFLSQCVCILQLYLSDIKKLSDIQLESARSANQVSAGAVLSKQFSIVDCIVLLRISIYSIRQHNSQPDISTQMTTAWTIIIKTIR